LGIFVPVSQQQSHHNRNRMPERALHYIQEFARIPSFSSWEEVCHPWLLDVARNHLQAEVFRPEGNSLILQIPGRGAGTGSGNSIPSGIDTVTIALAAHIDKINHFGEHPPDRLPVITDGVQITGQMDDAAGVGICLALAEWAAKNPQPVTLLLLLSEMEESMGLREHPQLLRDGGAGLHHGLGAERIARFLTENDLLPEVIMTIDTTPLFRGEPGVALYPAHWEFTGREPGGQERARTEAVSDMLMEIDPAMKRANNTNDYLVYGRDLGLLNGGIPSLAIEPAIFPYHQKDEKVFISDIERVLHTLKAFIGQFGGLTG
jgi:hypothetical protein